MEKKIFVKGLGFINKLVDAGRYSFMAKGFL